MGELMIGSCRAWAAAGALVASLTAASAAQAGFDICNQTDGGVTVAFGYREGGVWTSTGWWNIDPGQCATVYSKSLREQYYYYYAEEIDGQGYWGDNYTFCAIDEAFTIEGDENCKSRGYDAYGFRQVDVGEDVNYSIDLVP
jgi:uncharacterized membrane protein